MDFERLPFALRKEDITFAEFVEWASNRTLSIGRSYAKEILDTLRIEHIPYRISSDEEIHMYLSEERKEWLQGVGETIVHSKLFTSEEIAMVTFEEFAVFCRNYGLNLYEEAKNIDREFYLKMQIADYILNNNDRHEQNWGFLMENVSGKLIGFCPLFDHDHAFASYDTVLSQTTEADKTLLEAALEAQAELQMDFSELLKLDCSKMLSEEQWKNVLDRVKRIM